MKQIVLITNPQTIEKLSYIVMFLFLFFLIPLHLFPCFISGFLTYEIINTITLWFEKIFKIKNARYLVIFLIIFILIIFITLNVINFINVFITSDYIKNFNFSNETKCFFKNITKHIPPFLKNILPKNIQDLKIQFLSFIESHLITIKNISHIFFHGLMTSLLGIVLGTIISVNKKSNKNSYFSQQLFQRIKNLSLAFHNIVFAQTKISLLNTFFTSIMLIVILPSFNIYIPFNKTLIILTFIFGLIPILGNIISNTFICIASCSISFTISMIMIVFLITIHKLEYFINAKIIGNYIHAKSWEILLAMLLLESIFGMEGLMAAPIFYAYIKTELRTQKLI